MSSTNNKLSIYYRYFIYSKSEADRLRKISEGINGRDRGYELGVCYTSNGVAKNYTSVVNDLSQVKVSDAEIVMKGDIRKISHKAPVLYG